MTSDDNTEIKNKSPSAELLDLIEGRSGSDAKSGEVANEIFNAATQQGFSTDEIRAMTEQALATRGLSKRRIRQLLPKELKPPKEKTAAEMQQENDAIEAAMKEKYKPHDDGVDYEELYKRDMSKPEHQPPPGFTQAIQPTPVPDPLGELERPGPQAREPFTKEYTDIDTCVFRMGLKPGLQTPEEGMLREMSEYVSKNFPFMLRSGWVTVEVTIKAVSRAQP